MQAIVIFLLILTALGMVAAWVIWSRRERVPEEAEAPLPSVTIRVAGWRQAELQAILEKFGTMYDVGPAQITRLDGGIYDIAFRKGLTATNASFLVNYLHYPHDFDLDRRSITAAARYPERAAGGLPGKADYNDMLMIFVPVPDDRYDRVWGVIDNSGRVFEQGFARMEWQPVTGRVPENLIRLFASPPVG